ncbi:hypothetical protein [Legionella fairfieldensis]|uniref:hypothetical protein n=1 Tax=Legionella fairfieldensis TaxID=45064 RepID=UPI00048E008F|nr:hypothetical protein [Legionella fairfieldensis]
MNAIKRFSLLLWDVDPGYFRLKHAMKTVLAILIALWLVRKDTMLTKAMAGIICGMSMQGIVAKPFFARVIQIISFNSACFSAFILGFMVRDLFYLKTLVLMGLGFTVNYLRRFGLHNSMAPMMIWVLCFVATILPFNATTSLWESVYGLLVGVSVSALVMLVIFPENYSVLFVNNSNRLFKLLSSGLSDLRRHLLMREGSYDLHFTMFMRVKESMHYLLESNQAIEESTLFAEQQPLIDDIMIQQYALVHAYTMIIETYRTLSVHEYKLSNSLLRAINRINKQFAFKFYSSKMNKTYYVTAKSMPVVLTKLSQAISREHITDPDLIMILLNLKLGFSLLNQHLNNLLRKNDAT